MSKSKSKFQPKHIILAFNKVKDRKQFQKIADSMLSDGVLRSYGIGDYLQMENKAEELECIKKWLDKQGAPTHENEWSLSYIGRIMALVKVKLEESGNK